MNAKQSAISRRDVLKLAGAAAALSVTSRTFASPATRPGYEPTKNSLARLFMTDEGRGQKNVLFLRGWTCDSEDWSWQLPVFERRYRVIAADLRGHGRSEVMPSGSYGPRNYVADVEALVSAKSVGGKFVSGHWIMQDRKDDFGTAATAWIDAL